LKPRPTPEETLLNFDEAVTFAISSKVTREAKGNKEDELSALHQTFYVAGWNFGGKVVLVRIKEYATNLTKE